MRIVVEVYGMTDKGESMIYVAHQHLGDAVAGCAEQFGLCLGLVNVTRIKVRRATSDDERRCVPTTLDPADASIEACDGTQIIERQGPRGSAEPTSGDGRERSE